MSLLNKVALVTGASSGIGAAIAQKFAVEGAKLAIVGRNEQRLQEVSKKCAQYGNDPLVIVADVTKDAKKTINDVIGRLGKLDVLVNNAGISRSTSIFSSDVLQAYDLVINTNLRSIVSLTNLASSHLVETKGNIINISSVASKKSSPITGFAYNVSKAGLDHFTRTIAVEFARHGVRVNSVNPGPVQTDIVKNMGIDEVQQEKIWDIMKRSTVLNRISDPEEIADLVLFLASDKAKGVTGASFVVDNGSLIP